MGLVDPVEAVDRQRQDEPEDREPDRAGLACYTGCLGQRPRIISGSSRSFRGSWRASPVGVILSGDGSRRVGDALPAGTMAQRLRVVTEGFPQFPQEVGSNYWTGQRGRISAFA